MGKNLLRRSQGRLVLGVLVGDHLVHGRRVPGFDARLPDALAVDITSPAEMRSRVIVSTAMLAIRAARRTLITAITNRITQKRLTAAQAACALHLTGPKVTKLFQANIDEFTLDELVNMLPALDLTIQVVTEPQRYAEPL